MYLLATGHQNTHGRFVLRSQQPNKRVNFWYSGDPGPEEMLFGQPLPHHIPIGRLGLECVFESQIEHHDADICKNTISTAEYLIEVNIVYSPSTKRKLFDIPSCCSKTFERLRHSDNRRESNE